MDSHAWDRSPGTIIAVATTPAGEAARDVKLSPLLSTDERDIGFKEDGSVPWEEVPPKKMTARERWYWAFDKIIAKLNDSPPPPPPPLSAAALSSPQEAVVSQESPPATTASPCQDYKTISEGACRTAENTRGSGPHTACHGHSQRKEEQGKEHEEGNTGNQVPGSPTDDQESSLNDPLNEDSTSIDALKEQIRKLKTELSNSEELKEEMEKVVGQLLQEKQQLEEKNKIIKELQQEKAEMEEDVELLRENVDREITERQEEYTKNNSMVRSLKKKLSEAIEEKSSLQQELKKVTHELNEKKIKEKQLMINKQLHDDQMEELKQDLIKKEMSMKKMESHISALTNENEDIKSSFKKLQSEVNDGRAKLTALQEKYMTTLNQLLVMSVETNNAPVVAQTLENGADIEILIDDSGRHPLHLAAAKGHAEVVWHLLQKGAKATSVDSYGDLPIHIASREGNHHVVDELLKLDKSLANSTNGQGWNAAQCAARMGHVEVLKTLDAQVPQVITCSYQHHGTLLTHTVDNNHLEASEWLIAKGVRCDWTKYSFFEVFCSRWWHLILALWLTQARKLGLAAPVYVLRDLLRWWLGNKGKAEQKEEDNHCIMEFFKKPQQKWEQQKQKQATAAAEAETTTAATEAKTEATEAAAVGTTTTSGTRNPKKCRLIKENIDKPFVMTSYGLPNLGNTCYMNSVLQCLYHSQPFTGCLISQPGNKINVMSNQKGEVATAYRTLCVALSNGTGIDRAAKKLKQLAGKYDSTFQGREQQEAHDFLCSLLQWLHEDLTEPSCSIDQGIIDKSAVSDLFYGTQRSTVTCCIKNKEIIRTEESFSNLSLPVTEEGENKLQELLVQHFMEQDLIWECNFCGKEHECAQKTSILTPPKLLIIHLSRYTEGQPHHKKLKISFPENGLRLHPCQEKRAKEYQLYALCDHTGSMKYGHYTAFCRTNWKDYDSQWMYFNDSMNRKSSLKEALRCHTAHILFYRSVN